MSANKTQMNAWVKEIKGNWKWGSAEDEHDAEFYEELHADNNWNDPEWRMVLKNNIANLHRPLTVEEAKYMTLVLRKWFPESRNTPEFQAQAESIMARAFLAMMRDSR